MAELMHSGQMPTKRKAVPPSKQGGAVIQSSYSCPFCGTPLKREQQTSFRTITYPDGTKVPRRHHTDCYEEYDGVVPS
jgi:hypothetical protein